MNLLSEIIELLQGLDIEVTSGEDVLMPSSLDAAIIDSFDIVNIISALEDKYDVEIDGTDIIPENFFDVNCVVNLIRRYLE